MNQRIGLAGSGIAAAATALFALFMAAGCNFGSYIVCMILPIGYNMTAASFCAECANGRKAAANMGMAFGAIYAALVLIVYFTQTTAVRLDPIGYQAALILDYTRGGLFFDLDLLGYAMLSVSAFFVGLTIAAKTRAQKALKALLMIHGVFFFSCFIAPMTGVFRSMSDGSVNISGVVALECWCAYFLAICVLSVLYFGKEIRSAARKKSGSAPD